MAEPDFIEFLVKLPTTGKDGRDLTGDRLGPGGYRRDDGTLSAQATDFRRVQRKGGGSATPISSSGSLPPWAMNAIEQALVRIGTLVVEEVAIPAAKKLWKDKVAPSFAKRKANSEAVTEPAAPEPAEEMEAAEPEPEEAAAEVEAAIEDSLVDMSAEEAQWHVDEARAAFERFVEHVVALRNARVMDAEDIAALIAPHEKLTASGSKALEASAPAADESEPEPERIPLSDEKPGEGAAFDDRA